MTCQDFEELSGAYVLGSLTREEREAVEEHLAHCPACTVKLQELQSIANLLPLAAPDVEPPIDMKTRFFARLQQEEASGTIPARPTIHSHRARPARTRKRHWSAGLLAVAAALIVALLSGMTLWNLSLQQQIASLSTSTAQVTTYGVQGTSSQANAHGQLTCYRQQNICVVVMHGLAPAEGQHVYQGWLLKGKQPISLGLFNVNDGTATLSFQGYVSGYDAAAVSLEPGPVASKDSPRGPVVAVGSLRG